MSATKDIDDDSIDQSIHSDDMHMKSLFEMFQFWIVEFERFESFLEISGIYPMMKVRRFLFFFEKLEHMFAIVFEKYQEHNSYNTDNKD